MNHSQLPNATDPSTLRLHWVGVALSIGLLLAFALAFHFLPLTSAVLESRRLVHDAGPIGPVLFVLIFIAAVTIPPIPERPLVLSAGILFDVWTGSFLTILGATAGATVNFLIARRLRARILRTHPSMPSHVERLQVLGTWPSILIIRAFAGFTFDWYSYLLGLLRTRLAVATSATAIGITPGVLAEVYAGSFLIDSPWVTVAIGLALLAISILAQRFLPNLRQQYL